jgi:argininosuccinate synthase
VKLNGKQAPWQIIPTLNALQSHAIAKIDMFEDGHRPQEQEIYEAPAATIILKLRDWSNSA